MNTRLCKDELTRIPVWVKIHDVPIQAFSEDDLSIITSNIESLTIGVPLIKNTGFTIETVTIEYEWKPPRCDLCKILGHIHNHCPKKVSISPIVATSNVVTPTAATSNVVTPTVEKTNDGFQIVGKKRKATTSAPKKGTTNVDESDEGVKNVYDESDNLFQNTKTDESSPSFTAVVG
nr:hypothetical protein [Tanacetum cinerariifolium]